MLGDLGSDPALGEYGVLVTQGKRNYDAIIISFFLLLSFHNSIDELRVREGERENKAEDVFYSKLQER